MSELYGALRRLEQENRPPGSVSAEPGLATDLLNSVMTEPAEIEKAQPLDIQASSGSRLVAFSDTRSLGAEKFRALAARLDNSRKQREMKSLQVTSSVIGEGKTFVAGNLAVTLGKAGYKTLLIEGDLHRPTLASSLGFGDLRGLTHWWLSQKDDIAAFLHRVNGMPLWLLTAGKPYEHPADILQSSQFAEAFGQLTSWFQWVVVDSTPMQPTVDANLWSRLVDGALLVVREGLTPVKALKMGLRAIDDPKFVGVVMNEVSEFDHAGYEGDYYPVLKEKS